MEMQRQADIFREEFVEALGLKLIDSSFSLQRGKFKIFGDTLIGANYYSRDMHEETGYIYYKDLRSPQLSHHFDNLPLNPSDARFDALQDGHFFLSGRIANLACIISTTGAYTSLLYNELFHIRKISPYRDKFVTIDMNSVRVFDKKSRLLFTFKFTDGNVDLAYGVLVGNQFIFVENVGIDPGDPSSDSVQNSYSFVHSIDLDSLKIKWEFKYPKGFLDRSNTGETLYHDEKYLPLHSDSATYFFDWKKGKLEFQLPKSYRVYIGDVGCYLDDYSTPYMAKFDPLRQKILWKSQKMRFGGAYKNYVWGSTSDERHIVVLNANNGKLMRKIKAPQKGGLIRMAGNYVIVNNIIYQ